MGTVYRLYLSVLLENARHCRAAVLFVNSRSYEDILTRRSAASILSVNRVDYNPAAANPHANPTHIGLRSDTPLSGLHYCRKQW